MFKVLLHEVHKRRNAMRTFTAVIIGLVITVFSFAPAYGSDNKALYDRRCGSCHGPTGEGRQNVADLKKIDKARMNLISESNKKRSDADLMKIVREGKEAMKAIFAGNLSDKDLEAIICYVRTLQKKK